MKACCDKCFMKSIFVLVKIHEVKAIEKRTGNQEDKERKHEQKLPGESMGIGTEASNIGQAAKSIDTSVCSHYCRNWKSRISFHKLTLLFYHQTTSSCMNLWFELFGTTSLWTGCRMFFHTVGRGKLWYHNDEHSKMGKINLICFCVKGDCVSDH